MKSLKTIYASVHPNSPESDIIRKGAEILKNGGLVAFPTETVYGLGANALDTLAVARVYQVKGRPSDNPLIWHANSLDEFNNIVGFSSDTHLAAQRLANAFWPGPLTLILPSSNKAVRSIAVRVPAHPVTRALIEASGCIIAAPSANLSGRPSPTKAKHVASDLDGAIEMIIDGGPTQNGLESTVIDLYSKGIPKLLRPGSITLEMLQSVLGEIECPKLIGSGLETENLEAPLSPGMKYRHYAPKAPLILIIGDYEARCEAIHIKAEAYKADGKTVGLLTSSPQEPLENIAKNLFDKLREFDDMEVSVILAEGVKEEGIGTAIMNRLRKAAAEVIYV
ncbi:MAG: L-threonylcarbamoyladenylate synthase [Defluviitaleaceae bacterium]|nr:L-threonylcarbamoyladenylate synthase [Defluviitaleaceae bacterium]